VGESVMVRDPKIVARYLLDLFGPNGEHWTQGYYSRDKNGEWHNPLSKAAVCWCLEGGTKIMYPDYDEWLVVNQALADALCVTTLHKFNDRHDWPVVKASLERVANG
jgi:hypothetical protein